MKTGEYIRGILTCTGARISGGGPFNNAGEGEDFCSRSRKSMSSSGKLDRTLVHLTLLHPGILALQQTGETRL